MTLEKTMERNGKLFEFLAGLVWAQGSYQQQLPSLEKLKHIHDFIDELACDELFDVVAAIRGEHELIEEQLDTPEGE